jgi:hypothetical protein
MAPFLVYLDSIAGSLRRLDLETGDDTALPCLRVGAWSVRVAADRVALVALDPTPGASAVVAIEGPAIRAAARDPSTCRADTPRGERTPLPNQPYHGLLDGDRLLVTVFRGNLVEHLKRTGPTSFRREAPIALTWPENLGLSELLPLGDDRLALTANGHVCFERHCVGGVRMHASHVFLLDRRAPERGPIADLHPAGRNASAMVRDPSTGDVFVINAGELAGGTSSLQRLRAGDATFGPERVIAPNGGIGAAAVVGNGLVLLRRMSGEHLFVLDPRSERILRALRFDGRAFAPTPTTTPLPDRAAADFQDIVLDASDGTILLIDAKGRRLVRARVGTDGSIVVVSIAALGGASPGFGFLVDRE